MDYEEEDVAGDAAKTDVQEANQAAQMADEHENPFGDRAEEMEPTEVIEMISVEAEQEYSKFAEDPSFVNMGDAIIFINALFHKALRYDSFHKSHHRQIDKIKTIAAELNTLELEVNKEHEDAAIQHTKLLHKLVKDFADSVLIQLATGEADDQTLTQQEKDDEKEYKAIKARQAKERQAEEQAKKQTVPNTPKVTSLKTRVTEEAANIPPPTRKPQLQRLGK